MVSCESCHRGLLRLHSSRHDHALTSSRHEIAAAWDAELIVVNQAAEGLVGFQPLDGVGDPVPIPDADDDPVLNGAFPASGTIETPVRLYGYAFEDQDRPRFNDKRSSRIFGIEVIDLPPVGEIFCAYGVVAIDTPLGPGEVVVREPNDDRSNPLPFTVFED